VISSPTREKPTPVVMSFIKENVGEIKAAAAEIMENLFDHIV
jgi:hypothetical protein